MNPGMMAVIFGTKNLVKVGRKMWVLHTVEYTHFDCVVGTKGKRNIKISLLVVIVFDRDGHIVSLLLSGNDNDLSFLFENI